MVLKREKTVRNFQPDKDEIEDSSSSRSRPRQSPPQSSTSQYTGNMGTLVPQSGSTSTHASSSRSEFPSMDADWHISGPLDALPSDPHQPTPAQLKKMGIRVRDFAYESKLPPIPAVRFPPRTKPLERVSGMKRTRDSYEEDSTPSSSQLWSQYQPSQSQGRESPKRCRTTGGSFALAITEPNLEEDTVQHKNSKMLTRFFRDILDYIPPIGGSSTASSPSQNRGSETETSHPSQWNSQIPEGSASQTSTGETPTPPCTPGGTFIDLPRTPRESDDECDPTPPCTPGGTFIDFPTDVGDNSAPPSHPAPLDEVYTTNLSSASTPQPEEETIIIQSPAFKSVSPPPELPSSSSSSSEERSPSSSQEASASSSNSIAVHTPRANGSRPRPPHSAPPLRSGRTTSGLYTLGSRGSVLSRSRSSLSLISASPRPRDLESSPIKVKKAGRVERENSQELLTAGWTKVQKGKAKAT